MMFRLARSARTILPLLAAIAILAAPSARAADDGDGVAVVPTRIIYPGQELTSSDLQEVDVTNPNIRSDYVHLISELHGMVATRTLLPGRVIPSGSVRRPFAVEQGQAIRLIYSDGALTISAPGMPLENAAIGDFIKVRNVDSGITVEGTVTKDGNVEVAAQ